MASEKAENNFTMKKTITILAATLLATAAFAVQVGKPAPDFTGTNLHGKPVKLSDYRGKIVVLESFNPECPFCRHQYQSGAVQELQKEFTGKGVVWLIVDSVNAKNFAHLTPEQARQEQARLKMNVTGWIDDSSGAIGQLYNIQTTPQMFVINQEGTLVYDGAMDNHARPTGDPRQAKNYVRAALNELLAGKPVTIAETKPYGCAVKYAD
jgi:peroxiredoxin